MKKERFVFVGISDDGDVFVSTTLKGLCRLMGLKYGLISRTWQRYPSDPVYGKEIGGCKMMEDKSTKSWKIQEKELDTSIRKGNKEFGKTIKAPRKVVNTWKEGDPE